MIQGARNNNTDGDAATSCSRAGSDGRSVAAVAGGGCEVEVETGAGDDGKEFSN